MRVLDSIAEMLVARRDWDGQGEVGLVPTMGFLHAGHLSLVRDLVRGRFDPVPAGLADAGHVRWFTRASLGEALEEAGWKMRSIESWPGAPASESADFLARLEGWPGLDPVSLGTYQWIAVATARPALDPGP